jgi:hypothetical protein
VSWNDLRSLFEALGLFWDYFGNVLEIISYGLDLATTGNIAMSKKLMAFEKIMRPT